MFTLMVSPFFPTQVERTQKGSTLASSVDPLGSPLVRTTLQVFEVFFWMQLHGSRSPKRTQFMGNVSTMGLLDKGRLSQKERKKRTTLRTTRSLSGDCALHTQMLLHAWHRSIDIYIYIYINYTFLLPQSRQIFRQAGPEPICWRQGQVAG